MLKNHKEMSLSGEPNMLEDFCAGEARPLLFIEHLNQQVLRLVRNRLPLGLIEVQVPKQDVILGLLLILADEGHASSQHSVEDDAEGPNIRFA